MIALHPGQVGAFGRKLADVGAGGEMPFGAGDNHAAQRSVGPGASKTSRSCRHIATVMAFMRPGWLSVTWATPASMRHRICPGGEFGFMARLIPGARCRG